MTNQEIIRNWFRRVGINPFFFELSGNDDDGVPWAKRFWKTAYRDMRQYSQIANHANNELKEFRGYGVLKRIWAKSGNCIGRVRVDNLAEFDNNKIVMKLKLADYNPNRRLNYE